MKRRNLQRAGAATFQTPIAGGNDSVPADTSTLPDGFPYTFGWSASGCDVPFRIRFYGDPATDDNGLEDSVSSSSPNTRPQP